jgi:hypothetical protein
MIQSIIFGYLVLVAINGMQSNFVVCRLKFRLVSMVRNLKTTEFLYLAWNKNGPYMTKNIDLPKKEI